MLQIESVTRSEALSTQTLAPELFGTWRHPCRTDHPGRPALACSWKARGIFSRVGCAAPSRPLSSHECMNARSSAI
jgi:hypothetical protein